MVEIKSCARCGWLPRSAWMAQELLGTFGEALGGVTLLPSSGGIFEVRADGELVWSRKETGRFPEMKELKRAVRERCVRAWTPVTRIRFERRAYSLRRSF